MKKNEKPLPVAHDHPILYVYAGINGFVGLLGLLEIFLITRPTLATVYPAAVITIAIYVAIFGYIATSPDLKKILVVLKVLLALQVIGLLLDVTRPGLSLISGILAGGFTLAVFMELSTDKQPAFRNLGKRKQSR